MHSIQIIEANTTLHLPESAPELNREQTIAFSRLLLLFQQAQLTYYQFRVKLVYALLNLKRTATIKNNDFDNPIVDNVNQIAKLIDTFFTDEIKEGKTYKIPKMEFIHQKLPTITVDKQIFYGPTDALFNTVYGEYLQVLTHFNNFSTTNNESDLDLMIATIYRPSKHMATLYMDKRKKFDNQLTEHYSKTIAKLPFHVKYAIYLYVASSQHFIVNNDALDIGNGNTVDLTILFQKEDNTNPTKNNLGLVGTLYSIAETNVFGNVNEVANHNTYDILCFLAQKTAEYNKLKTNNNASIT